MTEGSHPFGTRASRISNILHDKATLEKLNNLPGWQSIIKNMISIDPMNRPCAEKILFNEDFSLASGSEWTQCDSANFCVEKKLNEYASQGTLEKPNEGGGKKRTVSEESGVYGWGSHDSQENSAFSSKQLSHTTNDSQLTSDAIRRGTLGAIAATSIGILVGKLLINSRNRPYNHERSWKHVQISSMASNEDFPSTSTESKGMLTPVISYNKSELLGKGSFGTKVYKGKFDGRAVAVKVISCTLVEPAKVIEEIQFLKLLDEHENIVRYIVAAKDENFIYIALELCSNNLQNVIENSLPLDSMDAITKCSKGLSYLHQNKIIHRDLKPANILINRLGQIKISDFGLATEIEDGFTSVTINGALGTADWMAPETLNFLIHGAVQNESLKVTTSSDIFSLGCIFYFVLTKGQHPFGKQGDRQYHIRHNNLQIHDTSIDKEMLHLIKSMLSQFPKERPDISMVLHELILKQKRLMYTDQ